MRAGVFIVLFVAFVNFVFTQTTVSPIAGKLELWLDWSRPTLVYKSVWAPKLIKKDLKQLKDGRLTNAKDQVEHLDKRVVEDYRIMMEELRKVSVSDAPVKIEPRPGHATYSAYEDQLLINAMKRSIDRVNRERYEGKSPEKAEKDLVDSLFVFQHMFNVGCTNCQWAKSLKDFHDNGGTFNLLLNGGDQRNWYNWAPMARILNAGMIAAWSLHKYGVSKVKQD